MTCDKGCDEAVHGILAQDGIKFGLGFDLLENPLLLWCVGLGGKCRHVAVGWVSCSEVAGAKRGFQLVDTGGLINSLQFPSATGCRG